MKLPPWLARLRGGARQTETATDTETSARPARRPGLAGLFGGRGAILVLAEDARGLAALVARKAADGGIALSEPARADLAELSGEDGPQARAALLGLALERLAGEQGRLPRRAAVVSAAGMAALTGLPVEPERPKPAPQMLEMVRYELEPAIATHNGLWTLGEVLAARGVLDPDSRRAIGDSMACARAGSADGSLRFGETAIALGLAQRADIDVALRAHQALQILDSEIACGWRGYPARGADGQVAPHWLAAGLGSACRDGWLEALASHGLKPIGFWPRAGLAGAGWGAAGRLALALEVWPEQVLRLRLAEGKLAGFAAEPRMEQTVTAEWLADHLTEWLAEPLDAVHLMVADRHADAEALARDLQPLLRCPVAVGAASPAAMEHLVWETVARDALAGAPAWVAVPPGDPRAPIWKRPGARGWLALAGAVLALAAWEGHAWWRIHAVEQERALLARRLESSSSDAAQGQALAQEARALDQEANTLRGELATTLARADMMDLLARRAADVPDLIRALGHAIDDMVVLEGLKESTEADARIGIQVRAWSTGDGPAQDYAARVQSLVAENGLAVAQADLRSRHGRQGNPGFEVSFWLVPAADMEQEAAETGAPAGAPAAKPAAPAVRPVAPAVRAAQP